MISINIAGLSTQVQTPQNVDSHLQFKVAHEELQKFLLKNIKKIMRIIQIRDVLVKSSLKSHCLSFFVVKATSLGVFTHFIVDFYPILILQDLLVQVDYGLEFQMSFKNCSCWLLILLSYLKHLKFFVGKISLDLLIKSAFFDFSSVVECFTIV